MSSSVDQKKRTTIISKRNMAIRMNRPSIGNSAQFFAGLQEDDAQSNQQIFTRTIMNSISSSAAAQSATQSSKRIEATPAQLEFEVAAQASSEQGILESDDPFIQFSNNQPLNSKAGESRTRDGNQRKRLMKRMPESSIALSRYQNSQLYFDQEQQQLLQQQQNNQQTKVQDKTEDNYFQPVVFSNALLNKSLSFFPYQPPMQQQKQNFVDFNCQTEEDDTEEFTMNTVATTATSSEKQTTTTICENEGFSTKIKLYFDRKMLSAVKILEDQKQQGKSNVQQGRSGGNTSTNASFLAKKRNETNQFFFKLPSKEQTKYGDKSGSEFQDRNQKFLMQQESLLKYLRSTSMEKMQFTQQQQQQQQHHLHFSQNRFNDEEQQQQEIEGYSNNVNPQQLRLMLHTPNRGSCFTEQQQQQVPVTTSASNSKRLEYFPSIKNPLQQKRQVLHLKPIPLIQPVLIDVMNEQSEKSIYNSNKIEGSAFKRGNAAAAGGVAAKSASMGRIKQISSGEQYRIEQIQQMVIPQSLQVSPNKLEKRQLMTRLIRCRNPKRSNEALAQTCSKLSQAYDDSALANQSNTLAAHSRKHSPSQQNFNEGLLIQHKKK